MERNLSMLTDLYQLTMLYGYFREGMDENLAVFDLYYRKNTGDSAYAVVAGLEQVIDYLQNLRFLPDDIDYLRSLELFDAGPDARVGGRDFFEYLSAFRFTGELYAMPEGSVVFPNEPLLRVKAPLGQAQMIETALLNILNHQTLIATKASRVCLAAGEGAVLEFGLRRAQGPDAGVYGARATMIGGCVATSNVLAGETFGIPIRGTHAHSWVMSFPDELRAFRAYARHFPDSCLLLVDTYDTLKSGVPNAITVFQELKKDGHQPLGIRLDSGDLAYLSKKARAMLDAAGLTDAKIYASNDLDEHLIRDLKAQGARIDVWGVGTQMITGGDCPALGGVYKLAAEQVNGSLQPKMKLSDNIHKMSYPGYKKVIRFYDKASHKALADLICLDHEDFSARERLRIYHPHEPWKSQVIASFTQRVMLQPVFLDGRLVYDCPSIEAICSYARQEMASMWDEYKRPNNPSVYKVDLSDALYDLRQSLLKSLMTPPLEE